MLAHVGHNTPRWSPGTCSGWTCFPRSCDYRVQADAGMWPTSQDRWMADCSRLGNSRSWIISLSKEEPSLFWNLTFAQKDDHKFRDSTLKMAILGFPSFFHFPKRNLPWGWQLGGHICPQNHSSRSNKATFPRPAPTLFPDSLEGNIFHHKLSWLLLFFFFSFCSFFFSFILFFSFGRRGIGEQKAIVN